MSAQVCAALQLLPSVPVLTSEPLLESGDASSPCGIRKGDVRGARVKSFQGLDFS